MKKIIIGILILAILGTVGFVLLRSKGSAPNFRTVQVARGNIVAIITATGTINPVTSVLVGTQVSGTIQQIYVDYNSRVKKGQILAQIDPAPFEAKAQQERANLLQARANVEKAQVSLVDTKRTLDRNTELYEKKFIAKSELDTAETNYEAAKAQLSVANAQVAQEEAALEYAETNLKYTKILSPVNGVVVSRNVDVGQTVAASFQTPTLFTIAQDLTKMQIDTNVDEADIGKVKVDQEVEFNVDAYPDSTFKGKVWQIRIAPLIVQNVVTYDVVATVDNPEMKLKPGMTANVSIIVAKRDNVLRIPNAALRFRPADAARPPRNSNPSTKRGSSIWILENGKPKRVGVRTGISDGSYTEVVAGQLEERQEVIVESLTKQKGTPTPGARGPRFF
jgi:HlyD family secretion protein